MYIPLRWTDSLTFPLKDVTRIHVALFSDRIGDKSGRVQTVGYQATSPPPMWPEYEAKLVNI